MIHTKKVAGRRKLRFETVQECEAEVGRLCEAERAGRLKALGNWTLGQTLGHLASWIEYAYEGYPMKQPPWVLRAITRLLLGRLLNKPASPGLRLPGVAAGTYGTEPCGLDEGEARVRAAYARLLKEPAKVPSPLFGMLSKEDLIKLHLRHAELHLSFLVPM